MWKKSHQNNAYTTYNYWHKVFTPHKTVAHGHLEATFIYCAHETHDLKAHLKRAQNTIINYMSVLGGLDSFFCFFNFILIEIGF